MVLFWLLEKKSASIFYRDKKLSRCFRRSTIDCNSPWMDRHQPSISTVFSCRWININLQYWSCFQVGESALTVDIECDISTGWLKKHQPISDTCVNVWHVWRSQNVTILNLWPRSHALLSPSKTDLVKFWLQMSQMVTNSNVTGTKKEWRLSQKQQILLVPRPKKNPKRLGLVRATVTLPADFDVITERLWSTITAMFPCVALSWKFCSLLRKFVNYCQTKKRWTIWVQLLQNLIISTPTSIFVQSWVSSIPWDESVSVSVSIEIVWNE